MRNILKITLIMSIFLLSIGFVLANENITDGQTVVLETSLSETNLTDAIEEEQLSDVNEDALAVNTNDTVYTVTDDNVYAVTSDTVLAYSVEVEQSSIADRTFKMGKYKITLSKSQYSALLYAKQKDFDDFGIYSYMDVNDKYGPYTINEYYVSSDDGYEKGLMYYVQKYTGKTVKQKIGYGFKGYNYITKKTFATKSNAKNYKKTLKHSYLYVIKKVKIKNKVKYRVYKKVPAYKKVVTKNAKVYILIHYGAGQYGEPVKYTMNLFSQYENPGYELVSGDIRCHRISGSLHGLKTAKTIY